MVVAARLIYARARTDINIMQIVLILNFLDIGLIDLYIYVYYCCLLNLMECGPSLTRFYFLVKNMFLFIEVVSLDLRLRHFRIYIYAYVKIETQTFKSFIGLSRAFWWHSDRFGALSNLYICIYA